MARTIVRHLLTDHGLPDMSGLGTFAASELLANAYQFTPGQNTNLSMRWRFGVLRLTVFDEHPAHARKAQQACQARRREALSTLDTVVGACGGIVGLDDAGGPLAGSKTWVALSREAARAYAAL
ncbi:ATP-binding protein [Streptomyces sp. NPDC001404]|uniref:ATP-binding protein n=1 Tax=Streptomyces sp. NPDC001404 TaxID=3364571 RepID=UPI003692D9DB